MAIKGKSANDTKPSGITKHYHCWLCFMKDGNNFCLATCENLEKER
jgi:predicted nucleic acid-binding Zn ribbon protein